MNQVRLLRCGILPTSSPGFVAFLGSHLWLPVFVWLLLQIRGFCDIEFENPAQQQPVWSPMSCFSCSLSSPQDLMHCTLSLTVSTCTPCQWASFISKTDSFSWGHDPYILACKARPSFDGCRTSLSVSLSLSLSPVCSLSSISVAECAPSLSSWAPQCHSVALSGFPSRRRWSLFSGPRLFAVAPLRQRLLHRLQFSHCLFPSVGDHEYISLLRKIYRDQKASVQTDEESKIFDIQKGSKQGDPMSSLLFNTVLQYSLKDEIQRWQKKKGMGINLTMTATASRTCDLPTTWCCSQPPKNRYGKWCANSRRQPRKWDSGFTQTRRRFSATRAPSIRTQKTYWSRWNEHRNIDKKWKREIFGTENLVPPTRDIGNQEQDQSSLGDLPQIQTRVDIKKTTCSNIVYDFSTPQFLRLSATQQEHGHRTRTTKEWFNRRNARC